jgi:hypothetical protein
VVGWWAIGYSLCNKELRHVCMPHSSRVTCDWACCAGICVCTSLELRSETLLAVGGDCSVAAEFSNQQILTTSVSRASKVHRHIRELLPASRVLRVVFIPAPTSALMTAHSDPASVACPSVCCKDNEIPILARRHQHLPHPRRLLR